MNSDYLPTALNIIDGERERGTSSHAVINPAQFRETVGFVEYANLAIVDRAVASAQRAAVTWRRMSLAERSSKVNAAIKEAERIATSMDLPRLLTREQGKILAESAADIGMMAQICEFMLESSESALQEEMFEDARGRQVSFWEPLGVVAVVTPWNWPIVLSISKVVPALLAGNTAVLKPAPNTPLAISEIAAAISKMLPPGVFNLVHGAAEVGGYLVSHPGVDGVSFTGSIVSGSKVNEAAARTMKRVNLELGGNDPAFILDDANIDDTMLRKMVAATFITTGQVCVAIKRIYVHDSLYNDFVGRFTDAANEIVVGSGLTQGVTMGPLNNTMQFEKFQRILKNTRSSGAKVLTVGRRDPSIAWDEGYFLLPSIVTDVRDDMELVTEEQFGPAVPIMSYGDTSDIIERSNKTVYGLGSSVWSSDRERAINFARDIQAGNNWINGHGLHALDFRFTTGGIKQSGLGLTDGAKGIRAYTNLRSISAR